MKLYFLSLYLMCTCVAYSGEQKSPVYFRSSGRTLDGLRGVHEKMISDHYRALEEPSFLKINDQESRFRFLYLPFRAKHICINVSIDSKGTSVLSSKALGYDENMKLVLQKQSVRKVDAGQLKNFVGSVGRSDIFKMKSSINDDARDGEYWVFELVMNGRHHVVIRHSPLERMAAGKEREQFISLCQAMLKLAGQSAKK